MLHMWRKKTTCNKMYEMNRNCLLMALKNLFFKLTSLFFFLNLPFNPISNVSPKYLIYFCFLLIRMYFISFHMMESKSEPSSWQCPPTCCSDAVKPNKSIETCCGSCQRSTEAVREKAAWTEHASVGDVAGVKQQSHNKKKKKIKQLWSCEADCWAIPNWKWQAFRNSWNILSWGVI